MSVHDAELVAAALRRDRTVDITTIGARTGRPHRIEIWYVVVADRVVITGTPRPRDWLANLRATPSFQFHLKESLAADLSAYATEVVDPAARAAIIDDPACAWYRERAPRDTLVAAAPMVAVTFDPPVDLSKA